MIEHRYEILESFEGLLYVHEVPAELRRSTVRLLRPMNAAYGRFVVPITWWNTQPKTPEEAATQWRRAAIENIESLKHKLEAQEDTVRQMDENREKIIKRFKKLKS